LPKKVFSGIIVAKAQKLPTQPSRGKKAAKRLEPSGSSRNRTESIPVSRSTPYSDFEQWQADVKNMRARFDGAYSTQQLYFFKNESDSKLGSFWQCGSTPDNIVKNIGIYW